MKGFAIMASTLGVGGEQVLKLEYRFRCQDLVKKNLVTGTERTTGGVRKVEWEGRNGYEEKVIGVEEVIVINEGT